MAIELNNKNYLRSGLIFSLALSATYLPILLGVSDGGTATKLILGLVITAAVNFSYIFLVKDRTVRKFNFLLIIVNAIFSYTSIYVSPHPIEGNVFAFSLIFLFFPWLVAVLFTADKHQKSLALGESRE